MRGTAVLAVLALVYIEIQSASIEYASLQRLKRSPHYDCGPQYPPPPPFWPPPPPQPPFWPPPPPHYRQPPPPPPPPPAVYYVETNQAYSNDQSQPQAAANSESNAAVQTPCDTCGTQNSALSNAKSDTGTAVAVAVAKAQVGN